MSTVEDYGCRLYVQFDGSKESLITIVADALAGNASLHMIDGEHVFATVTDWSDFELEKISLKDGFLYYKFSIFLEPIGEVISSSQNFHEGSYLEEVFSLIKSLRASGALVVASCEFEKLIAEKTGWNWSEETPYHP